MSKSENVKGKAQGRTCWNCRWLSEPWVCKFDDERGVEYPSLEETRVVCLKDQWGSSAQLTTLHRLKGKYEKKAEQCEHFELRSNEKHPWHLPRKFPGDDLHVRQMDAQAKIRYLVRRGLIPSANEIPCSDCGHVGPDKKHHYDHFLGYAPENQLRVQAVCTSCHGKRHSFAETQKRKRGEVKDLRKQFTRHCLRIP